MVKKKFIFKTAVKTKVLIAKTFLCKIGSLEKGLKNTCSQQ